MIDIHCHLLPGIDDGPRNWEDSLDLCRAMVDDGIEHATTTPHLIDGVYENTSPVVQPLLLELRQRLREAGIALKLDVAAEIDISSRFVATDAPNIPTLSGHGVLLEMPVSVVPHSMAQILFGVSARGYVPILAHPERNQLVQDQPDLVLEWVQTGAALQLDAESLLGIWGRGAERAAIRLLELGVVSALASDAHSTKRRPPRLTAGIERAVSLIGERGALLATEGPASLLRGELPEHADGNLVKAERPPRAGRRRGWRSLFGRRSS